MDKLVVKALNDHKMFHEKILLLSHKSKAFLVGYLWMRQYGEVETEACKTRTIIKQKERLQA